MTNILLCKISLRSFTMAKILEFYQLCQTAKSNICLFNDEITCEVNSITRFVSFILTIKNKDLFIIVEGKDARDDKKQIKQIFNQSKDPILLVVH